MLEGLVGDVRTIRPQLHTPQSRVDIRHTVLRNGKTYSEIIVPDVQVLAVDQTVVRDAAGKSSAVTVATVAMTPEDALTLELGKNVGRFQAAVLHLGTKDNCQTA